MSVGSTRVIYAVRLSNKITDSLTNASNEGYPLNLNVLVNASNSGSTLAELLRPATLTRHSIDPSIDSSARSGMSEITLVRN